LATQKSCELVAN